MKILVINGPNLNFLGIREPEIYGKQTYEDMVDMIREHARGRNVEVEFLQSNHEGALVDAIQQAYFNGTDGIVINPAAYTHTSIAIADALKAVRIPTAEVHVSEPDEREEYRHTSMIRDAVCFRIAGKGLQGYIEAMDYLIDGDK